MDKEPITLNGLNKLKDELIFLKEKKRPEIVAAIAEARSHGDLKEMQSTTLQKKSSLIMREGLLKLMISLLEQMSLMLRN